jgi:hypothetical protein
MVESIALMGCVGGALGLGVILGYTFAQKPTVWSQSGNDKKKTGNEKKSGVKLAQLSSAEFPALREPVGDFEGNVSSMYREHSDNYTDCG